MSSSLLSHFSGTPLPPPPPRIILDDSTGRSVYHAAFLSRIEADALLRALRTVEFYEERVVVHGRAVTCPRRCFAFGEGSFTYSGITRTGEGWRLAELEALLDRIEKLTGHRPNYAHANLYRDGNDYIGWHADDEKSHVPGAPIVSLSLGAERDFQLRRREDGSPIAHTVALAHGSLITMEGKMQRYWKHAVPKRKKVKAARYNVTFRVMKGKKESAKRVR